MNFSMMSEAAAEILIILTVFMTGVSVRAADPVQEEFVVLEKVYAFTAPEKLLNTIDALLEEQLVPALGIMPVYEHTNYPAMMEFLEVIRYAQAQNCRILLHFPIVQSNDVSEEEILEVIDRQIAMYEEQGVHPGGILLSPEDSRFGSMTELMEERLPVFELEEKTAEYYDRVLKKSFPLLSTSRLPVTVSDTYHASEIPDQFDFHRGIDDRITVSLEEENHALIIIVAIGIAAFLGMILFARKRNRKDFLGVREERR